MDTDHLNIEELIRAVRKQQSQNIPEGNDNDDGDGDQVEAGIIESIEVNECSSQNAAALPTVEMILNSPFVSLSINNFLIQNRFLYLLALNRNRRRKITKSIIFFFNNHLLFTAAAILFTNSILAPINCAISMEIKLRDRKTYFDRKR